MKITAWIQYLDTGIENEKEIKEVFRKFNITFGNEVIILTFKKI